MKPSEFKISISVESYDEKTAENYRNCFVAEKHIVSKLLKISIPNVQIEDLNVVCVNIPHFYTFQEICGQRALLSGRVESVHR